MSYTYGMKGAPAVGGGLGGLPTREASVVAQTITKSPRAIHSSSNPSTTVYDPASDCHYFSAASGLISKAKSDGTLQWAMAVNDGLTYTLEKKWASGGTKAFNGNKVISISFSGSVDWAVTVGAGTYTIQMIQSDSFGATFVFLKVTASNTLVVTKLAADGTLVWSRGVVGTDGSAYWADVAPGPDGAVYGLYFFNNIGIEAPVIVARIDTLNINQPLAKYSASTAILNSLEVDATGLVYICCGDGSAGSYPRVNIRSADLQTQIATTGFANASWTSTAWRNPRVFPTGQGAFLLLVGNATTAPFRFSVSRYTVSGSTVSFGSGLLTPAGQSFTSDGLLTKASGITPGGEVWLSNFLGNCVLFDRSLATANYGRLIAPGTMNFQATTFTFTTGAQFNYSASTSSAATVAVAGATATAAFFTRDAVVPQIVSSSFGNSSVSLAAQQV